MKKNIIISEIDLPEIEIKKGDHILIEIIENKKIQELKNKFVIAEIELPDLKKILVPGIIKIKNKKILFKNLKNQHLDIKIEDIKKIYIWKKIAFRKLDHTIF